MSENLRTYTRSIYAFDAVANRVDPAAWAEQSPCQDWCAKEVVGHALTVANMVTGLATGSAGEPPSPMEAAGDDPIASWAAARDGVLEALDRQGVLQEVAQTPFGEMPIDDFIGVLAADPVVHAWDLAQATGQPHGVADDLAEQLMGGLQPVSDALRGPGLFDDPAEPPADADAMTRLAAFTGRQV